MNHYPNHPSFITVAEFDARGQYQNVNVAQLVATESTETTAVYDVRANQTPVLVPHLAPFGKNWLWSAEAQKWTLIDNYAVIPVYSKTRVEQCAPPLFGDKLTDDMTLNVPPSDAGKITYWDAKTDGWAMRKDWSGTQVWSTADPLQSIVLSISDVSIPDGYTDKQPPSPAYDWDLKKSEWVLNDSKQDKLDAQAAQQAVAAVKHALQAHIDAVAIGLGFSGGNSVMLYAGFANAFQSLAKAFGAWEADIWAQANQYMAQVKSGDAPMLTPEQVVERIPNFEFAGA